VRLATFNVLHGLSMADGAVDLGRLSAAVAEIGADLIGLQELDRAQPRSGGHDLAAEVARALGAEHRFAAALIGNPAGPWRAAVDGDDSRPDLPAYGVGLVSRLPVRRWGVHRLPALPIHSLVPVPGNGLRLAWLRDEPRVLLAAVVDTPAGPMTVATTHLSFVPGWNGAQLRRVTRALRRLPAPRVLLGDLNIPGRLPGWLTGWRMLARVPTYPADDPRVQLDHVLADGRLPPVAAVRAWVAPLSDHRAVLVELTDSGTGGPGSAGRRQLPDQRR
jgi:endonuclease/exonuclease/phosphatase family metal-dependent hydrolase